MKTTFKIGFAAIIVASTLFSSCGKYDDGPKISLASKKSRICRAWTIEKFVDGATGTETPCTAGCGNIEYLKDGTYKNGGYLVVNTKWQFSSDKDKLEIIFGTTTVSTDNIIRLTSKEFWVRDEASKNERHYKPI